MSVVDWFVRTLRTRPETPIFLAFAVGHFGKYGVRMKAPVLLGACAGGRITTAALGAIQSAGQSRVLAFGYTGHGRRRPHHPADQLTRRGVAVGDLAAAAMFSSPEASDP